MKKIFSLALLSIIAVSCDLIGGINKKYDLNGNWAGEIQYEIMSENDYLVKSLIFSEDAGKCTVYTGLSFLNTVDEESLIVRPNGDNQLILTAKENNNAVYSLYFTEGNRDSFEMKWGNHTNVEKKYIPDKSLSVKMKRLNIDWN